MKPNVEIITKVHYNGSACAGTPPRPIEELFSALEKYTLMPSLEPYAHMDPITKSTVHFQGNFIEVSHAFDVETNDAELMLRLAKAIGDNRSQLAWKEARAEYLREIAAKRKRHA